MRCTKMRKIVFPLMINKQTQAYSRLLFPSEWNQYKSPSSNSRNDKKWIFCVKWFEFSFIHWHKYRKPFQLLRLNHRPTDFPSNFSMKTYFVKKCRMKHFKTKTKSNNQYRRERLNVNCITMKTAVFSCVFKRHIVPYIRFSVSHTTKPAQYV